MSKVNILLVDTNYLFGPTYRFLIQSGHNVTVVGGRGTGQISL